MTWEYFRFSEFDSPDALGSGEEFMSHELIARLE